MLGRFVFRKKFDGLRFGRGFGLWLETGWLLCFINVWIY